MDRRRDYRHSVRCSISLKDPRTRKVLGGLYTENVSASGLLFRSDEPHGLSVGDRIEVQLVARVSGLRMDDHLVLGTLAKVTRAGAVDGAIAFDAPLAF
jgi:hypothetical protein